MYRKQINIIIIYLLFSFIAFPQNSKQKIFEHLGPDQGMSSYIAPCMIQDRTGYLWFGTYNGVDRYDGHGFISYKHEPGNPNSINSGSVQALCEDKDGNIWVALHLGWINWIRIRVVLHISFHIHQVQKLISATIYCQFVKMLMVCSGLEQAMA